MDAWEQRLQNSQQEVSHLRQQLSECQQQLGVAMADRDDAQAQAEVMVSQEVQAAEQHNLQVALDRAQVGC